MKEILGVHWGMHLLEIEITYKCNLNCLHCYNRYEKTVNMPYEDIIELIKTGNENIVQKLVITGGEACMHPDFHRICEYISENRNSLDGIGAFVLQTNGYAKKCTESELRAFDVVHLSFDVDDNNLRVIDSEKQIKFALKLRKLEIYSYFFVTINRDNLNRIDEIAKKANDNNIPIAFNLCSSNNKDEEYLLDTNETRNAIRKLVELQHAGKIRPFKHPYMAIFRQTFSDTYIGNRAGCTAGIASCVVKADGTVIPCPFLRIDCGNIYNDKLEDIWYNSNQFALIRNRAEYKKCGSCKYVSYCGGCRKSAFEATGDLKGEDMGCILK